MKANYLLLAGLLLATHPTEAGSLARKRKKSKPSKRKKPTAKQKKERRDKILKDEQLHRPYQRTPLADTRGMNRATRRRILKGLKRSQKQGGLWTGDGSVEFTKGMIPLWARIENAEWLLDMIPPRGARYWHWESEDLPFLLCAPNSTATLSDSPIVFSTPAGIHELQRILPPDPGVSQGATGQVYASLRTVNLDQTDFVQALSGLLEGSAEDLLRIKRLFQQLAKPLPGRQEQR